LQRKERERLARIEAEKRAAEQKARCDAGKKAGEKNLILAKTFVRGITNKNINTAGSVMHSDIVINAPSQSGGRNVSRGISRAKQRLQLICPVAVQLAHACSQAEEAPLCDLNLKAGRFLKFIFRTNQKSGHTS